MAFGSDSSSDVRVVRVGTGRRLAATTRANHLGLPGTAVGWWGDQVLLNTGDGAESGVQLWDTKAGAVTRVGDPGQYGTAASVVGETALLHQGDGLCTAAVAMRALAQRWQSCDVFVAGSPSGSQVLMRKDAPDSVLTGYQVRDTTTGGHPVTLALPDEGVVSAGPVSGAGCRRVHQYALGARTGPAAGLALVASARG